MCVIFKDLVEFKYFVSTYFNGSLYQALSSAYPEYEWLPWRFVNTPLKFWEDKNNQIKFMEWAGKQLKIKELNDWYHVSNQVFVFAFFLL